MKPGLVAVAACAALAAPARAAEPVARPEGVAVAAAAKPAVPPKAAVDAAFLEFLGEAAEGDGKLDQFLLSRDFERAAQPGAARKAAKDGAR